MAKRTSDLFPAVIGGGTILLALFIHSVYEDLLKAAVLKRLSAFMDMPEAELVSRLAEMAVPIVGAVAVVWIMLWFAWREVKAEIPNPLLEAQRQQTEAILAHTEALKARPHSAEPPASGGPIVLAGIVNALMEKAMQYGFKMTAVPPGDLFIQNYQHIKDSTDPVWIDDQTARLRRDFLQYCAIVGSEERGVKELQSDRAELSKFGKRLIGKLTGAGKVTWKPTQSWHELERRFQELEPLLQYTRIDGQTGAAGEHWRMAGSAGRDAEDRFEAVARMASEKLFLEMENEVDQYNDLASESDPLIRWYKALQYIGRRYETSGHIVREMNEDGSPGGFIYTGSINGPAAASATLCLALASRS
jgi:hypothetical protein